MQGAHAIQQKEGRSLLDKPKMYLFYGTFTRSNFGLDMSGRFFAGK